MQIILKTCYTIGAIIICGGAILVTVAALFPPKDYKGDGRVCADGDKREESIEDV